MQQPEWRPGSFLDNLTVATMKLGYDYIPVAWGLAKVPWKSTSDRDAFLNALTRIEQQQ